MELTNIGEVIATRELNLKNGKSVVVTLGKPQKFPDGTDFYCPFQITGLGDEKIKRSGGVDAIQALLLAMQKIGTLLVTSPEYRSDELSWLGTSNTKDMGFPLPEILKDLKT